MIKTKLLIHIIKTGNYISIHHRILDKINLLLEMFLSGIIKLLRMNKYYQLKERILIKNHQINMSQNNKM